MKKRTALAVFAVAAVIVITALAVILVIGPSPETDQPAEQTVTVYFSNVEHDPDAVCDRVFPVERRVAAGVPAVEAALRQLVGGPQPDERAQGYSSFFSNATQSRIRAIRTGDSTVYLDLADSRAELVGANSSCGSASLLAQLEQTVSANGGYDRIIVAFDGDPELFYEWLQIGCMEANDYCDSAPFRR